MKLDINKIITLGNQEKYLVISHITNNEKNYYYIAELDVVQVDVPSSSN